MIDSDRTPMGDDEGGDVDETVRLLKLAGPRLEPPDLRVERVRSRVHAHWQAGARRRLARRRIIVWTGALAAAAALVAIVSRPDADRAPAQTPRVVALVARISGPHGQARRVVSAGSARTLAAEERLAVGETIETGDAARVALWFLDGTSVRLDVASRATLAGPRAVDLSNGAVYVDTGSGAERLEIRTPVGIARDIGTQFEVRLVEARLRLRVRTGAVEVRNRSRSVTGHAGTELFFSATDVESRPLAPYGPEWAWTFAVSPQIDIEGVALATYLERLAREQGWTVQYIDTALARDASGIILHGSVAGLAPTEALGVAIGTSGLTYRLDNGRLVVSREISR